MNNLRGPRAWLAWQLLNQRSSHQWFVCADCDALYANMNKSLPDLLKVRLRQAYFARIKVVGSTRSISISVGRVSKNHLVVAYSKKSTTVARGHCHLSPDHHAADGEFPVRRTWRSATRRT